MNRFLIVCLVVSGCTRGDDCITGEWRCAGDELQHCTQHGSNPIGSDPDGFIVWGINADRSWDAQAECGTNMCIDGTVTDRSFCAISATVEPRCAGVDNVCDGNVNVWCHDGYEIERVACTACDVSAGLCAGSLLSVCATDDDCADGMTCGKNGFCVQPCGCAEGTSCEVCDAVYNYRDPAYGPYPLACVEGVCQYDFSHTPSNG